MTNLEALIERIVKKVDEVENNTGESFLELIISELQLMDDDDNVLDSLQGFDYGLSRSRHWDKNEQLFFHDGIEHDNLLECLQDLELDEISKPELRLLLKCDGMTDLDEPINYEFEINIYDRQ